MWSSSSTVAAGSPPSRTWYLCAGVRGYCLVAITGSLSLRSVKTLIITYGIQVPEARQTPPTFSRFNQPDASQHVVQRTELDSGYLLHKNNNLRLRTRLLYRLYHIPPPLHPLPCLHSFLVSLSLFSGTRHV